MAEDFVARIKAELNTAEKALAEVINKESKIKGIFVPKDTVTKLKYEKICLKKRIEMLKLMHRLPDLIRIKESSNAELEQFRVEHNMADNASRWYIERAMMSGYENTDLRNLNEYINKREEGGHETEKFLYSGVAFNADQAIEMAKRIVDYKQEVLKMPKINPSSAFLQKRGELVATKKMAIIQLIQMDEIHNLKFWDTYVQNYTSADIDFVLSRIADARVNIEIDQLIGVVKGNKPTGFKM